jgi:hypothetical protein
MIRRTKKSELLRSAATYATFAGSDRTHRGFANKALWPRRPVDPAPGSTHAAASPVPGREVTLPDSERHKHLLTQEYSALTKRTQEPLGSAAECALGLLGGLMNRARSASDGCLSRDECSPRACAWGSDPRFQIPGKHQPDRVYLAPYLDRAPCDSFRQASAARAFFVFV